MSRSFNVRAKGRKLGKQWQREERASVEELEQKADEVIVRQDLFDQIAAEFTARAQPLPDERTTLGQYNILSAIREGVIAIVDKN